MAYTGNASVVYGASDLAPARKLFSDWGLKSVKRGNTAQVFETGVGGEVFDGGLHFSRQDWATAASDFIGVFLVFSQSARRHDGIFLRPRLRYRKMAAAQLQGESLFGMAFGGRHPGAAGYAHAPLAGDGKVDLGSGVRKT